MVDFPRELQLQSDRLYAYELSFIPHGPSVYESYLLQLAKQGDQQMKERVILSCLRYVSKVAIAFYKNDASWP